MRRLPVFIDSASGDVVPIREEMKAIWPELAEQKIDAGDADCVE